MMTEPKESYTFTNGWTMRREGQGKAWHLRADDGELVYKDAYRHDIISKFGLEVETHHDPFDIRG